MEPEGLGPLPDGVNFHRSRASHHHGLRGERSWGSVVVGTHPSLGVYRRLPFFHFLVLLLLYLGPHSFGCVAGHRGELVSRGEPGADRNVESEGDSGGGGGGGGFGHSCEFDPAREGCVRGRSRTLDRLLRSTGESLRFGGGGGKWRRTETFAWSNTLPSSRADSYKFKGVPRESVSSMNKLYTNGQTGRLSGQQRTPGLLYDSPGKQQFYHTSSSTKMSE